MRRAERNKPGVSCSVYLSKELHATARLLGINISDLCQQALSAEILRRVEQLQGAIEDGRTAQETLERVDGLKLSGDWAT